MESVKITVINETGLHARPAATFAKCAAGFSSEITVCKTSNESVKKKAKSLMAIMTLGIKKGEEILIEAEGEDEAAAVVALKELIESGCGE
ncbi:MAG: HPr family phosphocarrier protein [Bacillota bacterium]